MSTVVVCGAMLGAPLLDDCRGGSSLSAQNAQPVLVTAEWLAERQADPGLRVFHVERGDRAPAEEFIDGSARLDYYAFVAMTDGDLIAEMMPVDDMVRTLREAGVSSDSRVVLYGAGHVPARIYMTLDYLGLGDRTSVVDGGLVAWKSAGHGTSDTPAQYAAGTFEADLQDDVLVDLEWVRSHLDDSGTAVIDARPEIEYTGERPGEGLKPGHIPGAYNLYWEDLLESEDNPVLKSLEAVQARWDAADAQEGDVVVSYCYIGMRASFTYMISKHLGYDARFYDGSWNEWGARDDTPAVEGTGRR